MMNRFGAQTFHILYQKGMQGDAFDNRGRSELARRIAIAEEISEESTEVASTLRRMEELDLINGVSTDHRKGYTLTEKGFGVAHSRSLRRHEQELEITGTSDKTMLIGRSDFSLSG